MGTPRVYFGLHLYSTAWPIYDLAQRLQLGVEKWRLALLMGFNGKVRCDQRREGGKEGVSGTWGRNGRGGEGSGGGERRGEEEGGAQKALRRPLDADKPLLSPAGRA